MDGMDMPREIEAVRHGDARGFFSETWSRQRAREAGIDVDFVQDNHAHSSRRGVLRGLHYQLPPMAQDKLVRVSRGAAFCVAVDIRRSSPDYSTWRSFELSAERWNQLFVPKGFAFGYLVLEDATDLIYKVSAPWSPELERSIRHDDPQIAVAWPGDAASYIVSDRDRAAVPLGQADVFN